mgnify:CR=1 FL=1
MKALGIVRNIDELGRIVIPKELRTKMDIANGDPVEIHAEDDRIILKKYRNACLFCASENDLISFKGKTVCKICLSEMQKL